MHCIIFSLVLILSLVSVHGFLGRFNHSRFDLERDLKSSVTDKNLVRLFIELPVDHFNKSDSKKFKNVYLKSETYFRKDGPIILYINGESGVGNWYADIVRSLAEKTGGLIIVVEHRYYGASIPSEDIKYLSSKQALADMADLIVMLKKSPELKQSKVVTVGGSYAGMLSAWMRAHYPHLVDAAVSSSAPLLAKVNFYEYMDKVSEAFEKYGTQECVDKLKNNAKKLKELLSSDEGIKEIKRKYKICEYSDLKNKYNQEDFISIVAIGSLPSLVQYGSPEDIKYYACQQLKEEKNEIIIQGNSYKIFDPIPHNRDNCLNIDFKSTVENIKKYQRSWNYQSCNEFGYFQTTYNNSIFDDILTIDYYYAICEIAFGIDEKTIKNNVEETNKYYGGLNLNVTKVVFFNGDMDPWSTLGVSHDLNKLAPVNVVPAVSHCAEMRPMQTENEHLAKVRDFEEKTIISWLNS